MNDAAASENETRGEGARGTLPAKVESTPDKAEEAAALKLLPFYPSQEESPFRPTRDNDSFFAARQSPRPARAPRDWRRLRAAASLVGVVAIGAAAAAAHVHELRASRAEQAETRALAHRLDTMTA